LKSKTTLQRRADDLAKRLLPEDLTIVTFSMWGIGYRVHDEPPLTMGCMFYLAHPDGIWDRQLKPSEVITWASSQPVNRQLHEAVDLAKRCLELNPRELDQIEERDEISARVAEGSDTGDTEPRIGEAGRS
jgi:hypothetical protein